VKLFIQISVLVLLSFRTLLSAGPDITVVATDSSDRPAAGIRVELRPKAAPAAVVSAVTDAQGRAVISGLEPRVYDASFQGEGFQTVTREIDLSRGESLTVDVTLPPAIAPRRESVEVKETISPVEAGATTPDTVSGAAMKDLPNRPATVADALPMIPGVAREPGGALVISASPEHRSAMIVNSADVTDPGTGQFGLTVPMDSVQSLNVYQTPYLAEYGRFSAGLVSVETRRGGEEWKWELNDPLPEFFIRSWHLRGLRTATPRLNFEGPLIRGKVYFSEGFEYVIRKDPVYELPFPHNRKLEQGINSFSQLDWVSSSRNLVTATAHVAPQRLGFVNLDYFNPEQAAADARTRNYTGTLADQLSLGLGVWETTFSVTRFNIGVWGRGNQALVIAPQGNDGNYFVNKDRDASRIGGASSFAFAPVRGWGSHNFKVGVYASWSEATGTISENDIQIRNQFDQLLQTITFPRQGTFDIDDVEKTIYGQDHWLISSRFSLDLGVRTESQQVSGAFRVAPRGGFAFSPFANHGTVIRGGFGLFYERVPLNIYNFNRYPNRFVTDYGPDGTVIGGPYHYLNTLGQTRVRFPFVSQRPQDGNFSPNSANWSVQVEQPLMPRVRMRVSYLQNTGVGLPVIDPVAPDPTTGIGAYLLQGTGSSRYRQVEATARWRVDDERELNFSYVYSRARGDLNDFADYLGMVQQPIIRPDYFGDLPGSLPHRFLTWGIVKLTPTWRISPVVEYRSGFPFSAVDAWQNYAGIPDGSRFPRFFSVDARVSKDIRVNPKYAVRLSLASFNLTNHFNPETVHDNVNDPAYGYFFGHRGRRFTMDFDVLF
jgi:Carboxypeptidase regulatory-like domain